MIPQQQYAWMRLGSGRRLDVLNPDPHDGWTDADLAVGLSRTYRWGGQSRWELPLSVTQHSLTVLAIREQQAWRTLSPAHALRELLHDADEALIGGWDCPAPLKPTLGEPYARLVGRLRTAIATRYRLPAWSADDYTLHKQADRLAAASEALHVVGYTRQEIRDELLIDLAPLEDDPLQRDCLVLPKELRPWEPWPPALAARLFLGRLEVLAEEAEREAKITTLAAAFSRLPACRRARCRQPVTGSALLDTLVSVEAPDGSGGFEGVVVDGARDDGTDPASPGCLRRIASRWVLDAEFTVFTTDGAPGGALLLVQGHCCHVDVL